MIISIPLQSKWSYICIQVCKYDENNTFCQTVFYDPIIDKTVHGMTEEFSFQWLQAWDLYIYDIRTWSNYDIIFFHNSKG